MRLGTLCAVLLFAGAAVADSPRRLPWLGMSFMLQRPANARPIVHVQRVVPGGPADRGGIRPGDLITSFDAVPVGFGDELDLLLFLGDRRIGQRLACGIVRGGRPMKVEIVVAAMPQERLAAWDHAVSLARQLRERDRLP